MSETSVVIAGFGGQGVLFAGQLLAYGGMENGRFVTWIPSYGPEMRGGTAHCTVIISDHPIGAPIVTRPDVAIVLNQPSFAKYEPLVKRGGLLVINSSLVAASSRREEIEQTWVPADGLAEQFGTRQMANVAALGGMLAKRPLVPLTAVAQALRNHLPASKAHLLTANLTVLEKGYAHCAQLPLAQPYLTDAS